MIHAINTTATTHDIDVVMDDEADGDSSGRSRDMNPGMLLNSDPHQPRRQPIRVFNVLHPDNALQIISDQGPKLPDVGPGSRVCVRNTALKERCFVEGTICDTDLNKCPPVFKVAVNQSSLSSFSYSSSALPSTTTLSSGNHDLIVTVSRVQMRLLRPPWYEDLMLQKPLRFVSSAHGQTGILADRNADAHRTRSIAVSNFV